VLLAVTAGGQVGQKKSKNQLKRVCIQLSRPPDAQGREEEGRNTHATRVCSRSAKLQHSLP
jgi:hypothetical protein